MRTGPWNIGIVGTFDVQNYGDLLFPLIAERELRQRLGQVNVIPFSYESCAEPEWPYEVVSVSDLPEMLPKLDALLVGGGFLIRFDKEVAPGYGPPAGIHDPTGYWLTPSLLALQHDVPLVWNAPGMHCNEIPTWSEPLLEVIGMQAAYLAVRDAPSRETLQEAGVAGVVEVPDTGFGLARIADEPPSVAMKSLLTEAGIDGPYVIVQASHGSCGFVNAVVSGLIALPGVQFLALPIGPVLGDDASVVAALPGVTRLASWPHPLLLAELVRHSEAVVGHSYHLLISAVSVGVPGFVTMPLGIGKFTALTELGIHEPDRWMTGDVAPLIGRRIRPTGVDDRLERLEAHWDRVAQVIEAGVGASRTALDRLWQRLPTLLETGAELARQQAHTNSTLEATTAEQALHLEEQRVQIEVSAAELEDEAFKLSVAAHTRDVARHEILTRHDEVALLVQSRSWQLTAPVRRIAQQLGRPAPREPVLDMRPLLAAWLNDQPWEYAEVNGLFSPAHQQVLAEHCPTDNFRRVVGYGGEKDYSYDSREVVGFGKNSVSNPHNLHPKWNALATDLLSPQYRTAMSLLSGLDLSDAKLKVNLLNYQPGGHLGPHVDLQEKLVTHDIFVTGDWNPNDGGCLRVLRSRDEDDVFAEFPPTIGNSVVLKRSDHSWHAVTRVADTATKSRRILTATFYRAGSVSHMWPSGESIPVRNLSANGCGA